MRFVKYYIIIFSLSSVLVSCSKNEKLIKINILPPPVVKKDSTIKIDSIFKKDSIFKIDTALKKNDTLISVLNPNGRKYYLDPNSTSTIFNGTISSPLKSIAQLDLISLFPGDSIFFKRGTTFEGVLNLRYSGSEQLPIVYTNYGIGDLPKFTTLTTNLVNFMSVRYVILNGIQIIDYTINPNDHYTKANISSGINLNASSYCTISSCDISIVGVGITIGIGSNYNSIIKNNIHDLRMVRNTPKTINGNDDYGANGIIVKSSNNQIISNNFEECWANSYDYNYDGGAIEFFGATLNNNKVIGNTVLNSNGFIEIGSGVNGICENTIIAYNKVINSAGTGTFQTTGKFAIQVNNFQYYNNNFIETIRQFTMPYYLFYSSQRLPPNGMLVIKNNIFWLSSGVNVFPSYFNNASLVHNNNFYRMSAGFVGLPLNNFEFFSTNVELFTNYSGFPKFWDYNLSTNAPVINAGVPVGFTKDFMGTPIIGMPDLGILEKN